MSGYNAIHATKGRRIGREGERDDSEVGWDDLVEAVQERRDDGHDYERAVHIEALAERFGHRDPAAKAELLVADQVYPAHVPDVVVSCDHSRRLIYNDVIKHQSINQLN